MKTLSAKHATFTIVVLLLVATATVKAETIESGAIAGVSGISARVSRAEINDLNTSLPQVSNSELIAKMQDYRQKLENNREDLVGILEDNKFKAGDAFLTAIMPGGLLYAAYRSSQQEKTRKQLADVETLIEELGVDLVALKAAEGKIMVARWP